MSHDLTVYVHAGDLLDSVRGQLGIDEARAAEVQRLLGLVSSHMRDQAGAQGCVRNQRAHTRCRQLCSCSAALVHSCCMDDGMFPCSCWWWLVGLVGWLRCEGLQCVGGELMRHPSSRRHHHQDFTCTCCRSFAGIKVLDRQPGAAGVHAWRGAAS